MQLSLTVRTYGTNHFYTEIGEGVCWDYFEKNIIIPNSSKKCFSSAMDRKKIYDSVFLHYSTLQIFTLVAAEVN